MRLWQAGFRLPSRSIHHGGYVRGCCQQIILGAMVLGLGITFLSRWAELGTLPLLLHREQAVGGVSCHWLATIGPATQRLPVTRSLKCGPHCPSRLIGAWQEWVQAPRQRGFLVVMVGVYSSSQRARFRGHAVAV